MKFDRCEVDMKAVNGRSVVSGSDRYQSHAFVRVTAITPVVRPHDEDMESYVENCFLDRRAPRLAKRQNS